MHFNGYNQREKNLARKNLVINGIERLTTHRKQSMLVNEQQIETMLNHFVNLINLYLKRFKSEISEEFKESIIDEWKSILNSKFIEKSTDQLKVLYLAGPQPTNDLNILLNSGIKPYNIWAVEGNNKTFLQGINDLKVNHKYIKLHRGSLKSFFELFNEQFDIVYYDACSSLCSNNHNPINVLEELFANRRLTELSVLITNFSEPNISLKDDWGKLLACWYTSRYEDCPDSTHTNGFSDIESRIHNIEGYSKLISERIPEYYGDFIQKFISALASEIVPFIKIATFPSINSKLFKPNNYKELLKNKLETEGIEKIEELLLLIPHYLLAPQEYPLLNWAQLTKDNLPLKHPINRFLLDNNCKVFNSIIACSQLKAFEEGYSGFNTLIEKICSDELNNILKNVDFFDREQRLTVDIPMKNLLAELIIGQYAFPYIANAKSHYSLKYKANGMETWMYSDLFVFDQCRYLYDLLPSIELIEDYFKNNLNAQILIRCCIDSLLRHHFPLNNQIFKGGFIESHYNLKFGYATLNNRINLNKKYKLNKMRFNKVIFKH
jgi:hypothetical protein